MKPVLGLTGGIACGKSTVATFLEELGAIVIDADRIARDVVQPPSPVLDALVEAFGPDLLRSDGTLDRSRLARIVFDNDDARRRLESITHPAIAAESLRRIADAQGTDRTPIFYDAALLVENGTWRNFPGILVVTCSPRTQLDRLRQRDGLDESEARARIASQLPLERKERAARWLLRNDGTRDELRDAVAALLPRILSDLSSPPANA